MEPACVNVANQKEAWNNLYENLAVRKTLDSEFKVGDTVRISKEKLMFDKGYEKTFTREIFTIHRIVLRDPVVYKLKDFRI